LTSNVTCVTVVSRVTIKSEFHHEWNKQREAEMLRELLNKLGNTMAIVAFTEAGDFGMIEKAIKKEGQYPVVSKRKASGKRRCNHTLSHTRG